MNILKNIILIPLLIPAISYADYRIFFTQSNVNIPEPKQPEILHNCREILNSDSNNGSGIYTINSEENGNFDVYCDMTTDGGGWTFVNEQNRSTTNINDLYTENEGGYHRFIYELKGMTYNEILVERVNNYWCNSWGAGDAYWGENSNVSMGIAVDQDFFHYHSGQFSPYKWIMQPYSTRNNIETQPWTTNNTNTSTIAIINIETDGSKVKLEPETEDNSWLEIENYDAFIQTAGGCNSLHGETFKQRVFIR